MGYPYTTDEPHAEGMLDVGDGQLVHWTVSGNPAGTPIVLLHGGPGSGSSPRHRRMFDPGTYRIVQFDQRGCGESTPHAANPVVDLSTNTTHHLLADIELLRAHLGIDRWVVWGGSWGTTLGLAYAEAHPEAMLGLLLGSVVTTSAADVEWVTRTMGRFFPERWHRFVAALPPELRDGNLAESYRQLLVDPDPAVHRPAALAWCEWEDTHVSLVHGYEPYLTVQEPAFRLCFARMVTHYWAHAGFLPDGSLLAGADRLAGIPTFLAHGRQDVSAPTDVVAELAAHIPGAELMIVDDEGHGGPKMSAWIADRADRLVARAP